MKHIKLIGVGALGVLLGVLLFFLLDSSKTQKIAYVSLPDLLSQFDFAKESEQKVQLITDKRKAILDSLQYLIVKEDSSSRGALVQEYQLKEAQFEADLQTFQQELHTQVVEQLSQYLKDYNEKQKYDLILGARGDGAIMAASESINITEDVVIYINERYKGGAK
ncbi:OmpH family outer membrane protein [Saprospira sp. CCB-QB6]|uniref:OmpH family outer membrane protein n=1 Tax=Saprospira sp. CCB-QB6 TaxID=3023936 RepID=UPI00234BAE00|nr:OmpH family outer membrane protein [Saprospira sp. CCB-QB6]WCL81766.1 OmpH family outer membrane protein [Saprospira sp. CCB-QB6]